MPDPTQTSRTDLLKLQSDRLSGLLDLTRKNNPFYQGKWKRAGIDGTALNLEDFSSRFPFTLKSEIVEDQQLSPPFGTNHNFPLAAFTRCHQTSGTSGAPIRWLDTPECWEALTRHWMLVLQAAGVGPLDRVLFAFSFGPFLGFWLAFESATRLGCLCLPAGGLSSAARARQIIDLEATVVCCTPTYALRLAETAQAEGLDLRKSRLKRWIVAGEPGGSIPATRSRIENSWPGATVFDHHGMTETGPVTYECPAQPGKLHVIESGFIAEVIDPATTRAVTANQTGELVLTTLERTGSPLLRYRTGDLVRPTTQTRCSCGSAEMLLDGGILGRTDDMVVVRGVNVYPGAIEEILRAFPTLVEYRVHVLNRHSMVELAIDVEFREGCPDDRAVAREIAQRIENALTLRVPVQALPVGSLPRFEMKARRWIRPGSSQA